MLGQRVITAVLLLVVLLPALFHPSATPLTALAIVFIAAGAWEWARLVGFGGAAALAWAALCAAACGIAWGAGLVAWSAGWFWATMGAVWVLGGAWMLHGGVGRWGRLPRLLRIGVGLVLLFAAWLALAQARRDGVNFVLSILALVWAADIAAYCAGRAWGGRVVAARLAPGISPGKTWEGVWGAMLGVVLLALLWQWADGQLQAASSSLYTRLFEGGRWFMLLPLLWLVAMSVVGDLVESLLKRSASVKDSSALLPGHGGVLDRIDALLPTLPLAMLLVAA